MGNLSDISLNISEPEYRNLSALSYSAISRFEREGFKCLSTLYDPISSPSLTFGSMVDTLLTEGIEEYNNKFVALNMPDLGESIKAVVDDIVAYAIENEMSETLEDIEDYIILASCNKCEYQTRWKDETRVQKIRELATNYFNVMMANRTKTIVTQEEDEKAKACYAAIKGHTVCGTFFNEAPANSDIEIHHQLKFNAYLEDVKFKCMIDAIIVDNKSKRIFLADLKTTGAPEYEFAHSFIKYNYHMQARLYTKIFKECIKGTKYENYIIMPYSFLVVNKDNLCPLAYEFPLNEAEGDLEVGKFILKDPVKLGVELDSYLKDIPRVPNYIRQTTFNDICQIINDIK